MNVHYVDSVRKAKHKNNITFPSPGCCLLLIQDQPMRSAEVITMVTLTETTQVSRMELREPTRMTATLSPGLRRKKMLWQNAVKHIIIQQELSAQVIVPQSSVDVLHPDGIVWTVFFPPIVWCIIPHKIMRSVCTGTYIVSMNHCLILHKPKNTELN